MGETHGAMGQLCLFTTVQEPAGALAEEGSPEAHGGLPAEVHEG